MDAPEVILIDSDTDDDFEKPLSRRLPPSHPPPRLLQCEQPPSPEQPLTLERPASSSFAATLRNLVDSRSRSPPPLNFNEHNGGSQSSIPLVTARGRGRGRERGRGHARGSRQGRSLSRARNREKEDELLRACTDSSTNLTFNEDLTLLPNPHSLSELPHQSESRVLDPVQDEEPLIDLAEPQMTSTAIQTDPPCVPFQSERPFQSVNNTLDSMSDEESLIDLTQSLPPSLPTSIFRADPMLDRADVIDIASLNNGGNAPLSQPSSRPLTRAPRVPPPDLSSDASSGASRRSSARRDRDDVELVVSRELGASSDSSAL
eukprot:IDg12148t1